MILYLKKCSAKNNPNYPTAPYFYLSFWASKTMIENWNIIDELLLLLCICIRKRYSVNITFGSGNYYAMHSTMLEKLVVTMQTHLLLLLKHARNYVIRSINVWEQNFSIIHFIYTGFTKALSEIANQQKPTWKRVLH